MSQKLESIEKASTPGASLVATWEVNGVNPFEYLVDILPRLGTHPASRIDELLPQNWSPPAPS